MQRLTFKVVFEVEDDVDHNTIGQRIEEVMNWWFPGTYMDVYWSTDWKTGMRISP